MKLLSVQATNFMSYKSLPVINLDQRGLVLVLGENRDSGCSDSNQSGKSAAFVETIPWCLFGRTTREEVFGKTAKDFKMDHVVNKAAGRDCCVEVDFIADDGRTYCVQRWRKDKQMGNAVMLHVFDGKNWQIMSGETIEETEEKIRKLTGLTYETYCHAAIFAQGNVKRFSQCTDTERREIFDAFFDTVVFDIAWKLVDADLKDTQVKYDGAVSRNESILARIIEAERQLAAKTAEAESYNAHADRHDAEISSMLNSLAEAIASRDKAHAKLQRMLKQQKVLDSNCNPANVRRLTEETGRLRAICGSEKQSIADNEALLNRFKAGMRCPECLRVMLKDDLVEYKREVEKRITFENAKLSELMESKERLQETLDKARTHIVLADDSRKDIAEQRVEVSERELPIIELKAKLDALQKSKKEEAARARAIAAEVKAAQQRVDELIEQRNAATDDRERFAAEITNLQFWKTGFGTHGIRDFLHRRMLEYVNGKLIENCSRLTAGELSAQLEIGSDKIGLKTQISSGAPSYLMASGGAGRRIDLCIALGLQAAAETMAKVNLLIVDEFDEHLDATGVDMFIDFLHEEAEHRGSVFVISHNERFKDMFENVVIAQYEGGESKIL